MSGLSAGMSGLSAGAGRAGLCNCSAPGWLRVGAGQGSVAGVAGVRAPVGIMAGGVMVAAFVLVGGLFRVAETAAVEAGMRRKGLRARPGRGIVG